MHRTEVGGQRWRDMWRAPLRRALGSVTLTRQLVRAGAGGLIVLCYHDLREADDFSSWLRVEVNEFRRHLRVLLELGRFVQPADLDRVQDLPSNSLHFLLTFDDGYPNNLRLGAPVLEETGVPALFFVSSHHMVTGQPFWFDRIVSRIQAAAVERLDLTPFGLREYRFFLLDGAKRWEGIEALLTDVKTLGNADHPKVQRVLSWMDEEFGSKAAPCDRWFRPITASELKDLAGRPGVTIGSHAHRHDILTHLSTDEVAASAKESKRLLEEAVNTEVVDIAYPNGNESPSVTRACRSVGYTRGFVTIGRVISKAVDRMRIPRLLVGGYDCSGDVVAKINRLLFRKIARCD